MKKNLFLVSFIFAIVLLFSPVNVFAGDNNVAERKQLMEKLESTGVEVRTISCVTNEQLKNMYMYLSLVPKNVRQQFTRDGFVVQYKKTIPPTEDFIVAGLFDCNEKRIYISCYKQHCESSVVHEFGHYVDYLGSRDVGDLEDYERCSDYDDFLALNKKEIKKFKKVDDYAGRNEGEYFAEIYENIYLSKAKKVSSLRKYAPESFKAVESYIKKVNAKIAFLKNWKSERSRTVKKLRSLGIKIEGMKNTPTECLRALYKCLSVIPKEIRDDFILSGGKIVLGGNLTLTYNDNGDCIINLWNSQPSEIIYIIRYMGYFIFEKYGDIIEDEYLSESFSLEASNIASYIGYNDMTSRDLFVHTFESLLGIKAGVTDSRFKFYNSMFAPNSYRYVKDTIRSIYGINI